MSPHVYTPSPAQREAALQNANRVRSARSKLKRQLKDGEVPFRFALLDPDAAGMTVLRLLLCLPSVGPVKARKLLHASELRERCTVADAGSRRLGLLLGQVES